jgi:serine/alanine adding enzyme
VTSTGCRIISSDEARHRPFSWPDIYFAPEYGDAVAAHEDADWLLATTEDGQILLPCLRRRVRSTSLGEDCVDVVSPYGYSGVWAAEGVSLRDLTNFRRSYRDLMVKQHAVSEFLRLSPLVPTVSAIRAMDPGAQISESGVTVVVDLTTGEQGYWSALEGRARTAVRKARRLGYEGVVRIATSADASPASEFRRLYAQTMVRAKASSYYDFTDDYYRRLLEGLGPSLLMAEVRNASGVVVAAALLMHWGHFLHYHLSGSDWEAARDGANNLLIDAAAAWGLANGVHRFHLGGGARGDDPLLKFKRSFGGELLRFHTSRCVFDQVAYDVLVTERARELSIPRESLLASPYFPAYRARSSASR